MHRVMFGRRHATNAQIRGGAGFDHRAKLGQTIQRIILPTPHLVESLRAVGPGHGIVGRTMLQLFPLPFQSAGMNRNAISRQRIAMHDIVFNLRQPLTHSLGFMGVRAARHGHRWVKPEGNGMAEASRPHLCNVMAPTHRTFKRFIKKTLAHVIEHFKGAFGVLLIILRQFLKEWFDR